jgi:hypothetical protein
VSGFDKWLPFFEEASVKRDTVSWWSHLKWLKSYGVEVVLTVSDRAKALIQLAGKDYLHTCSMPDLFHFMQDLGRNIGGKLALAHSRTRKKLSATDSKSVDYDTLLQNLSIQQDHLDSYTAIRENINKAVHPFDENDQLVRASELEQQLQHSFTQMRQIAQQAGIDLALKKGEKILRQIPDIAKGVAHWTAWLAQQVEHLKASEVEKALLESLLPYAYWQVHRTKKTSKKKDKGLNVYYQQRVLEASRRFEKVLAEHPIEEQSKEWLVNWAFKQVATFHRASSQVEGRNGYLAFIHHANKGMTEQRRKVLTVVHNFDIRRADAKTPAQRLFNKEFPDLFEFVLHTVGELPKPRARKSKFSVSC